MAHLPHPYPPLFETGDRMSREEFIARWEQMPELKNAELIDGVVYVSSPVSLTHGSFEAPMHFVVSLYVDATPGYEWVPNVTWYMLESAPQPDLALYILPEHGGELTIEDGFASGAPQLAIEITRSSRTYDLGPKLALYQRAQVQEYLAALIEEQRMEWRVLENGSYRLIAPDSEGVFHSRVFPGLWIDSSAFWRKDTRRLRAALDEGLRSEEHVRFMAALEKV